MKSGEGRRRSWVKVFCLLEDRLLVGGGHFWCGAEKSWKAENCLILESGGVI